MAVETKSRDASGETTTIADVVVAKTAGIAASQVDGVFSLGSGMAQAVGAVRKRVPGGTDLTSGVKVEVGQRQTAIDLEIIVDYGRKISDVAQAVRTAVRSAVERGTGLEVVAVSVSVLDVRMEESDDEDRREADTGERLLR